MLQKLRDVAEDECGVLSNARCLTEGIDVPALDGEVFVDPKRSVIDIIQAVGRVLRIAPGKDKGHILLPVFFRAGEDPEKTLEDSAFKVMANVMLAMRSVDVRMGELIDNYRFLLGKRPNPPPGPVQPPPPITVDFGHLIGEEYAQAFILKLVERTCVEFEVWCKLMERFVEKYGHASPRASYRTSEDWDDDWALGFWVNTMRTWKKRGWLKPYRVKELEKRFPMWSWDALDDQWHATLQAFRDFGDKEGHLRVPDEYVTPDGIALGNRINTLRSQYNKGWLQKKIPERIQQLEALPWGWIWDAREAKWQAALAKYVRYVEETGNTKPAKETEDGRWINAQRVLLRKDKLHPERKKLLDEAVPGWEEGNKPGPPPGAWRNKTRDSLGQFVPKATA